MTALQPWLISVPPALHYELAMHLISKHADAMAVARSWQENAELHWHEHTGPGGIRNHRRGSLAFDENKAEAVLEEIEAEDAPAPQGTTFCYPVCRREKAQYEAGLRTAADGGRAMHILTDKDAVKIFTQAAEAIKVRGWTQHDREGTAGLTLDVAICAVTHGIDNDEVSWGRHTDECGEASDRMLGFMLLTGTVWLPGWSISAPDILATWNDDRARTEEEVVGVLRRAADLLAPAADSDM